MGSNHTMFKVVQDNGKNEQWINGERYVTVALVRETPPQSLTVPEDEKKYLAFTVKYCYFSRGSEKTNVTVLFKRDLVVERQGFDFSAVSEMLSDIPWKLPEALPPIGPWVHEFDRQSRVRLQFGSSRVLYFHVCIIGPYRTGGDEYLEAAIREPAYYDLLMKNQLKHVAVDDEDQMCPICLERFEGQTRKEVVSTHCSHLFHRCCLVTWLLSRNSCPFCRRVVIQ